MKHDQFCVLSFSSTFSSKNRDDALNESGTSPSKTRASKVMEFNVEVGLDTSITAFPEPFLSSTDRVPLGGLAV